MYKLVIDEEAIKFISKLPKELGKRIYNKITNTKSNPFHFFERLEGREDYKLRVGDYRVVADIDESEKTIKITLIGHRKNVYQKL